MTMGNRRPLYLSKDKDKDILEFIEPLLNKYNFSAAIRELVRDGIRYRKYIKNNVVQSHTDKLHEPPQKAKLQSKGITLNRE